MYTSAQNLARKRVNYFNSQVNNYSCDSTNFQALECTSGASSRGSAKLIRIKGMEHIEDKVPQSFKKVVLVGMDKLLVENNTSQ